MPIYEYHCQPCRQRFSVVTLRVSAAVESVCPRCGTRAGDRLPSRFSMPRAGAGSGDDSEDFDGGDPSGDDDLGSDDDF
ncbi:MAG: FmdB family zinc ribbon protein [bacterium]